MSVQMDPQLRLPRRQPQAARAAGFTPDASAGVQGAMIQAHRPQLRAKRDSLPRSERGVWGVWLNTPQFK